MPQLSWSSPTHMRCGDLRHLGGARSGAPGAGVLDREQLVGETEEVVNGRGAGSWR